MKRRFRAWAAGLMGAVLACAAVSSPMTASAYIVGDVDNSGAVSLADAVSLNKYLQGKIELVSYDAADTNANYVVDIVDYKILMDYIIEVVPSLPYTG